MFTQNRSFKMKKRRWYMALLVMALTVMTVPVSGAPEQGSTRSPSELQAMSILKKMSEFLAAAERFSVTIRDGYDVVQESGQKIEFGEVRNVTATHGRQDEQIWEIISIRLMGPSPNATMICRRDLER